MSWRVLPPPDVSTPPLLRGHRAIVLRVALESAEAVFSIDSDDRLTTSDLGQIRVTGGEMAGAAAMFELADGTTQKTVFDAQNAAQTCG
ncbi:hypothetical protein [Sulfitobacter sp. SK012]|uniref:hypothetical protein n=1 Tax=Sulfitobacter sp. SK012 TaxID=1389005 RepID=UPI0013B4136A|nr:hypothetical protein [Sulfitobacter sp. SK012]